MIPLLAKFIHVALNALLHKWRNWLFKFKKCFLIPAEQIAYKRIWNILFHVKVMAFNNSYRVAKLYSFSDIFSIQYHSFNLKINF